MLWSFICCVPIISLLRSSMSHAGVAARRPRMDDIRVVRLRFVDDHSACSCLQRLMTEAGDAGECRHAADERARVDLACVHGLAAGYKRGLDAAASGTVFCAGTGSPKIRRPLCLLPPCIIHDPEGKRHPERDDAPEPVSWSGVNGQKPIMWVFCSIVARFFWGLYT